MKKLLSVLLLVTLFMTGCAGSTTVKEEKPTEDANECAYVVKDTTIVPGKDFAPMLESLGEPVQYSEAASCYYDGMDKVYSYDGFEVKTYPSGDKDFVQDICMSSDSYKTPEGVTVGSTLEDVTTAYGEDYELIGKMYKYYFTEDTYMYFFIMNDAVKYFGYAIDAAN